MFKIEDAVSVDTSEYELAPPGMRSTSPGLVLAVMEGPQLSLLRESTVAAGCDHGCDCACQQPGARLMLVRATSVAPSSRPASQLQEECRRRYHNAQLRWQPCAGYV